MESEAFSQCNTDTAFPPSPCELLHCLGHPGAALTLQQGSSSTSSASLPPGTSATPVQAVPRLLSDTKHCLACPGSCSLLLALDMLPPPPPEGLLLRVGVLCSHSEMQEATEMLLHELERLCSCGWLAAGSCCWWVGS